MTQICVTCGKQASVEDVLCGHCRRPLVSRADAIGAEVLRWCDEADAHARAGRDADAVAAYEKALEGDPDLLHARLEVGVRAANLDRFEESLESFREVLRRIPQSTAAWNGKATTLGCMGRLRDAITALETSLDLDPAQADSWKEVGACLEMLGRPAEAIAKYDQAVAVSPNFVMGWLLKAACEHRLGRHAEAVESYGRFLDLAPPGMQAQIHQAQTALGQLKRIEARSLPFEHQEARDAKASDEAAKALIRRAIGFQRAGRADIAIHFFDSALEVAPADAMLWQDRGTCLCELGRFEDAVEGYVEAVRRNQWSSDSWFLRGQAEESLSRRDDAGHSYRMYLAFDLNAEDERKRRVREKLQEWGVEELDIKEMGIFDAFIENLTRISPLFFPRPTSGPAWTGMGRAFETFRPDLALLCFEEALALDATCAEALYRKGLVLQRRGNLEDALHDYRAALEIDPENGIVWWHRAYVEGELGRTTDQADSLRSFLEFPPTGAENLVELAHRRLAELEGREGDAIE